MKIYVAGTHEALLMSTHNVCFHGEIRKNISTFLLKKKKMPYIEGMDSVIGQ